MQMVETYPNGNWIWNFIGFNRWLVGFFTQQKSQLFFFQNTLWYFNLWKCSNGGYMTILYDWQFRLSIFTLRTCHYGNCYFDVMTKKQMPPPGSRVNFAQQNAKFYFHRLRRLMGLRMMQGSPPGVKVLLIEKMRMNQWNRGTMR